MGKLGKPIVGRNMNRQIGLFRDFLSPDFGSRNGIGLENKPRAVNLCARDLPVHH